RFDCDWSSDVCSSDLAIDAQYDKSATATLPLVEALVTHEEQTFSTGFHRGYDEVLCRVRDDPHHEIPNFETRADGSNLVDEALEIGRASCRERVETTG